MRKIYLIFGIFTAENSSIFVKNRKSYKWLQNGIKLPYYIKTRTITKSKARFSVNADFAESG